MDNKFSKLKSMLGMPLKALQASDDYFKDMVQNSDGFKAEVAGAQKLTGMDEQAARDAIQRKLDLAGSAGSTVGSIKPVNVMGSPEAMALARARMKMTPVTEGGQRAIAEKLSKIEEVPVALASGGVANPATAKNLNPYKAGMSADPALMGKSPQDAFKGLLEQAKNDPELLQKILARIKR
jgi:hypothetical protein